MGLGIGLAVGAGLSAIGYGQDKKASKAQKKFQAAMYKANVKGLRSGYIKNAERVHADQYRAELENSINLRENARQAAEALGLSTVASASRGVGGAAASEARRDIMRSEAENRQALNQRRELDKQAAKRYLEITAINTNAQILQAHQAPPSDPSLMNALIGGVQMGIGFAGALG